ncbi:MAG: glycosyltransferase family 9 protein [Nitrospiraceae bacterium]
MNVKQTEPARRTLLVIHPSGVGDVLLSLPAMRALKRAFPAHELAAIIGGQIGTFLQQCGEVEVVLPVENDTLAQLFAGPDFVEAAVRDRLDHCDLAVCWLKDHKNDLSAMLRLSGVRRVVACSPLTSKLHAYHQADRFIETLGDIVGPATHDETLRAPQNIRDVGQRLLKAKGVGSEPMIAIHPGSGSGYKCCDPALFASLIEWASAQKIRPVIIGGPADEGIIAALYRRCLDPPVLLQHLELSLVAGVLSHARLFVGHDSGISHLAAALHIPTIALFGPTDARRWRPRGGEVRIVMGESCRCGDWETVRQCPQRPCLQIHIEQVVQRCQELISAYP